MKNKGLTVLFLTTVMFMVFLLGFMIGSRSDRLISVSPDPEQSAASNETTDPDKQVYIDGLLNLNAATISDLMLLPGIGETLAKNILDYRDSNGPYKSIDDLLNVPGIGAGRLEKLKDHLTVAGG